MKKILIAAFAGLFAVACNNEKTADESKTISDTTTKDKDAAWYPVDSATMMKNMIEYGTPGPIHAMMASWDGNWTGETTMWNYEGATPTKSTGNAENKTVLGGKYQVSKHSGDMMGMPFEGMSILAYDNATKKFSNTWMDNWSTGIMMMTGDWDSTTRTMTLTGSYPDINRPGRECHMKQVVTIVDDNTQKMVMYGPDMKTGKEFKMMEMVMTRKK